MFASQTMAHPLTQIEIMNRLKKVGFTQEQSEVHAQIVTEINEGTLATKQDLKDLEKATDGEFVLVRGDISLLRKDIELCKIENKKDLEALKFDLTVRMTIIITSALTALTAIQKFLL